jgi:hypothetical protein
MVFHVLNVDLTGVLATKPDRKRLLGRLETISLSLSLLHIYKLILEGLKY